MAVDWSARAKNLLKAELSRRDITYNELALKLAAVGVTMPSSSVRNRLSRGAFSAAFMLQCLQAIGVKELRLDYGE